MPFAMNDSSQDATTFWGNSISSLFDSVALGPKQDDPDTTRPTWSLGPKQDDPDTTRATDWASGWVS
jgi:hypothetical protein